MPHLPLWCHTQGLFLSVFYRHRLWINSFLLSLLQMCPRRKRLKYRDLASLHVLLYLVVSSFLICQLQTYKYIKQWDNIRQTDWWEQLSPLIIFPGRTRCEGFAVQIISGGQLEHFDWLLKCNYKDRKNSPVWRCCSYLSNQTLFFNHLFLHISISITNGTATF